MIVSSSGVLGLWRGTSASLIRYIHTFACSFYLLTGDVRMWILITRISSNVPGIALYFTGLNQVRGFMAASPLFAAVQKREPERHPSVLPMLTSSGNLLAGATTRVVVGFALNPFSVLKARYEVRQLSPHLLHHTFL